MLFESRAGFVRIEIGIAGMDLFDGPKKLLHGGIFWHISTRAGAEDLEDIFTAGMDRMHQDLDIAGFLGEQLGRDQAIHAGHEGIHENNIRVQLQRLGDGFEAIASLAHDVHTASAGEERPDAEADHRMIVHQEQLDFV
jgi:hypothetical protein